MTILDEIFTHKRLEVVRQKQIRPLAEIQAAVETAPRPRDFVADLRAAGRKPALIAEVKFGSPSKGLLAAGLDPLGLANVYQKNGAAAVSVLTDERYFKGQLDYLRRIATLWPDLPLLRKDFICDPYQVYEAQLAGADALLLIVAGLEPETLRALHGLARRLGLTPLVEVHSEAELEIALECGAALIGINNRDLHDFHIDLEVSLRLRPLIPPEVTVVAESGIRTPADVHRLADAGLDAILVGEALVTAPDVGAMVRSLSGRDLD